MTKPGKVRGISRTVLATHAMNQIIDPACANDAALWSSLERGAPWRARGNPERLTTALRTIAPICSTCPALLACGQWAQTDEYSGFAAGAIYVDGERNPSFLVVRSA